MYLYSTSLFYFASCLFSSHPLPLQPVGTLNSCPIGSLSRTAAPGTAPRSSLPSSNTTVSPGEGKSPTQNQKLFQTYFTGFTQLQKNPCGNHKSGVELLYNYVCAVHMLLSFHDLSVNHYYRLIEICFFSCFFQHSDHDQTPGENDDQLCGSCCICQWRQVCFIVTVQQLKLSCFNTFSNFIC